MTSKEKPKIIKAIEALWGEGFEIYPAPTRPTVIDGLMACKKDQPKYALNGAGDVVGLNLYATNLTNEKWANIAEILDGKDVKLDALCLNQNELTNFSLSQSSSQLQQLDIEDNPLESPTEEIRKQGKAAVLRFLKDLYVQGERDMFEVKMLIVGEGETGKTTLWNLLQNPDHPVPDTTQKSTVGIQIKEGWKFTHIDKPEVEFLVNMWDFGGQDIQYMTHQFFLTRRSFYVLLADGRREVANFPYWLRIIELLGSDGKNEKALPLLVILNEKGNPIARMPYDPETVKKDYPKLEVIKREVDFADKEDGRMEALTKTIKDVLCREIDHIPLTVPRYWDNVRQRLSDLTEQKINHIDYNKFAQICEEEGINEKQQRDDLSQLLHDLGIILHFTDDILLADFIILNPQWAVNAIYVLMKHEEVKTVNQGRFDKELLEKVLGSEGYTVGEQGKLLNLMLKDNLEVCFRAQENDNYIYIAPQLLPEGTPPGLVWTESSETLRYIYHYPFMPKGIIGRLIVRLHEDIESTYRAKVVWEHGMVLKKDNCRALVRYIGDKQGRQIIKIEIQGNSVEDKKNVLRDIRKELKHIHDRSFPALKVYEKIPCNCSECRNSLEPFEHDYKALQENRKKKGKGASAQCLKSFEDVPVHKLLEGVFQDINLEGDKAFNAGIDLDSKDSEQGHVVKEKQNKLPWWAARLIASIAAGLIIAYFLHQYSSYLHPKLSFQFFDTWLASSSILALYLLSRNPKRRFHRAAYYVLGLLGVVNFLPQLDFLFKSEEQSTSGAEEWYLKLGIEDEPLISVTLIVLAAFLFYLDSKRD